MCKKVTHIYFRFSQFLKPTVGLHPDPNAAAVVSSDDVSQEEESDSNASGSGVGTTMGAAKSTIGTGHPPPHKAICNFVFPQFLMDATAATTTTTSMTGGGSGGNSVGTNFNTTMMISNMDPIDDLLQQYQQYSFLPSTTDTTHHQFDTTDTSTTTFAEDNLLGQYLIFGDEAYDDANVISV
jgi:hypothetical protein